VTDTNHRFGIESVFVRDYADGYRVVVPAEWARRELLVEKATETMNDNKDRRDCVALSDWNRRRDVATGGTDELPGRCLDNRFVAVLAVQRCIGKRLVFARHTSCLSWYIIKIAVVQQGITDIN